MLSRTIDSPIDYDCAIMASQCGPLSIEPASPSRISPGMQSRSDAHRRGRRRRGRASSRRVRYCHSEHNYRGPKTEPSQSPKRNRRQAGAVERRPSSDRAPFPCQRSREDVNVPDARERGEHGRPRRSAASNHPRGSRRLAGGSPTNGAAARWAAPGHAGAAGEVGLIETFFLIEVVMLESASHARATGERVGPLRGRQVSFRAA